MVQFTIEILTAVTIILIGVILGVYLSILKRNGWIGEASNYRCPNPQCRKIFQVPVKVKDFSTGKEVGFACPECGYDLGFFESGEVSKEIALKSGIESKILGPASKPKEARISTVNNGAKITNAPATASIDVDSKTDVCPPGADRILLEQKLDDAEKNRPSCCKHHFGYLGGLPTRTETLDECLLCPRLIECVNR